jgi:hypothetical protein
VAGAIQVRSIAPSPLNSLMLLTAAAYAQPVAIRAGALLGGKGGVQHNVQHSEHTHRAAIR